VPLQRLFFMNSDFMQQHAEQLAAHVVGETDDVARVQKTYRLIFGRAATPAEVKAAQEFLAAEPMKQYEEKKAEAEKKAAEAKAKAEAAKAEAAKADGSKADAAKAAATPPAAAPAPAVPPAVAPPAAPEAPLAGMMSGVVPGKPGETSEETLPVTVFGRYVKALLSSNEFLFIR
jgi:hypothetical protein